ncbi:MAG: isoprenyl transferase [Saprospiraceae bacterium]|nr:isoprenyl transferase [Saprospiraceae bacterium]MCB9308823.1 isoprenyl transferase [Lewinellaceae bacterium]
MSDYKSKIDQTKLPKHVAIIMDGNGRWAHEKGKHRVFGHRNGVKAVREVTEAAAEIGIEFLTLYAFSTENWSRPTLEVNALMALLVETVKNELDTLNKNNIRLKAIGDLSGLPQKTYKALLEGIEKTAKNDRMTLVLALNYSSRWEIVEAVKKVATMIKMNTCSVEDINDTLFTAQLATEFMPDPELIIRTSGELRISNYMLWQAAYAELYFTSVLWPDFTKEEFYKSIIDFQGRQRRFGKTGEQVNQNIAIN